MEGGREGEGWQERRRKSGWGVRGGGILRNTVRLCVCARARVRACVRACVRVFIL